MKKASKKWNRPYVSAVIPAAGQATRMGGLDKQFEDLNGTPILVRTMLALASSDWIDELVIVTRRETIPLVLDLIHAYAVDKAHSVVGGGATRQESVQQGIQAVSPQTAYVAIHDGARPLVDGQTIADTVLDAFHYGAAAAAVPVVDTIKIADEHRRILSTPDRKTLYAVQTPQVFHLATYLEAVKAADAAGKDFTDDCQLMEFYQKPVYLSNGSQTNLKITTPVDLLVARILVEQGLEVTNNGTSL